MTFIMKSPRCPTQVAQMYPSGQNEVVHFDWNNYIQNTTHPPKMEKKHEKNIYIYKITLSNDPSGLVVLQTNQLIAMKLNMTGKVTFSVCI